MPNGQSGAPHLDASEQQPILREWVPISSVSIPTKSHNAYAAGSDASGEEKDTHKWLISFLYKI